ncbi:unnamed protein product, partial [Rotaria sp. Silwood1]
MSNEIETDLTKTESLNDEKEELKDNIEQRTVPSIADVQSFCAEFHIKVDNAVGIRPWLQFSDTNFSEKILKQFEEDEFDMPTPIQSIAWPILSQNRDLVGIANSGSGKTLAFILPLIFHIRQQINDNSIAIILTSTRETQIRKFLDNFKTINTDEKQHQVQMSIFSATTQKSIKSLADNYLTNYVHASVGYLSEPHPFTYFNVQQIVDFCPTEQYKKQNLFRVLDDVCAYAPLRKTIIFVRTRDKVNRLNKDLEENGYKALLLHGSINQQTRNEILKEFRENSNVLLLTTDVASRSFDVDDVRFVINYDYPTSDAVYKHRITRIANCSIAFTFFSNEDAKHAPALIHILDDAGAMVHPIILQLGRKHGFNKWVANVGIPEYPVFTNYDSFDGDGPESWINMNEDLPPNLMTIDLSSFDSSQLRPTPLPLLNSNGALNELDVNTRMKNFQDYKQRCQMIERLSWNDNQNDNNNWNNSGGWSNPDNENQNQNNNNLDLSQKQSSLPNDNNQWKPPQTLDAETNPAIIYAKASSEYHIEYNQYTTALQQAMLAQQSGAQITPEQQQYLIAFQQKLQVKQQQLQVMQQAAALTTASTQNVWPQQQTNIKPQPTNDLSKTVTDAQQAWMQQWMNAGYDVSQIAAYHQ